MLPRVLFVDDDNCMRVLARMALEELHIDLVTCADLATARVALEQGPWALLVTDMMLPDGSGLELLRETRDSANRATPRLRAVISAGLTPSVRQKLAELAVDQVLEKPVSIVQLQACVRLACTLAAQAFEPVPTGPAQPPGEQALAIQEYFGGDSTLFLAFLTRCHDRFPIDLRDGAAAAAAGDMASLRLLVHSLKSVCRLVGLPELSESARQVELACQSDPVAAVRQWHQLGAGLQEAMDRHRSAPT